MTIRRNRVPFPASDSTGTPVARLRDPRGDEARRRILEAAIDEFAAHGYQGASTRSITARAEVNLGALTYYYEGKPNLYRAVLAHVAEKADSLVRPFLDEARRVIHDPGADSKALRLALLNFLDQLLDLMLNPTKVEWQPNWTVLMARAEFEPPEDDPWPFRSLLTTAIRPGSEILARLIGRGDVDDECRLITMVLIGQVSVFRALPGGHLPAMEWRRITSARRDLVRRVVHTAVEAVLDVKDVRDGALLC